MRGKINTICMMVLTCLLLCALTITAYAKESASDNEQLKSLMVSEEDFKNQIKNAIRECENTSNEASKLSISGFNLVEEPEVSAALIPDEFPSPGLSGGGPHTDWIDRAGLVWDADYYYWTLDTAVTHPQYVPLIDPEKYGEEVKLSYVDKNGVEREGTARTDSLAEVYYKSRNEEELIDGFYEEFLEVYSDFLVAYEAFLVDYPEVFWLSQDLVLCFPEIRIYKPEYYGDYYRISGYFHMLLVQYDKDGNKIYDVRLPQYQNLDVLKAAIAERDRLLNSIVRPVRNKSTLEQLTYFNWYLTHANELNVYHTTDAALQKLYSTSPDSFNCISALRGTVGPNGPTEEAYARAFHALCKEAEIPATVCRGKVGLLNSKRDGIWNLVQIKDKWQAVNCAWNDLTNKKGAAVSGDESELFFLCGMNTDVVVDGETILFGLAHSEKNIYYTGFEYKNGPVLAPQAYLHPIKEINVSASAVSYLYGYEDAPTITAHAVPSGSSAAAPVYAWVLIDPNNQETVIPVGSNSITFPEVTEPGVYRIRSIVAIDGEMKYKEIEIEVIIFKDIKENQWFYNAVDWALENGITYGLNNSTFGPLSPCTRAQIVTFIWRTAGSPNPVNKVNRFKDVSSDAYYYNAVLWAVENGITSGYNTEQFAPDNSCTRAEMVTFLWRVGGKKDAENKVHPYKDVKGDGFYYDAMLWAVEEGIAVGYTDTKFAPHMTVTRAETVTFLYRANGNPIETQKKNQPSKLFESKEMYDDKGMLYYVPNEYIEAGYMQSIIPFYNDFLITSSKVNDERRTVTKLVVFDTDSGKPIQETELISQEEFVIRVCGDKITAFDYVTGDVFILDTGLQTLNKITCDYEACGAFVNQDVTKIYYFISDGIYQYDIKSKKTESVYDKNIQMHDMRCFEEYVTFIYEDDTTQEEHNAVFNISTGEATELTLPSFMYDFWYMNDVWTGRIPEEADKTYIGAKNDIYTVDMPEDSWWFSGSKPDRFFIKIRSLEYDSGIAMYETDGTFVSKFDIPIDGNYDCYSMPDWVERDGGYYFIFTDAHNNDMLMYWDVSVPVEGEDLQLVKVEE